MKSFQTLIGGKKLGKEKRKSLGSKWCEQCQRVGNILPRYEASVARIHVPPHTNTRTHPLTRHAQIKTGDLESINVLTNPQLQHRVMIQTTSTPLIFRLFSQLFFFSRTQLTIKVFFFNVF